MQLCLKVNKGQRKWITSITPEGKCVGVRKFSSERSVRGTVNRRTVSEQTRQFGHWPIEAAPPGLSEHRLCIKANVKEARLWICVIPHGVNHSRPSPLSPSLSNNVSNKGVYIFTNKFCCHLLSALVMQHYEGPTTTNRVFGLLSSSLLLFPQRFGRYVLRPSSGVCRTREPSWNFERCPLLKPRPCVQHDT